MAKKKASDFSKYVIPDCDVYIGLDMSLTSPGICYLYGDNVDFLFFPQRKKHIEFENKQKNFHCKALGFYEDPDSREQRYDRIATDIMRIIDGFQNGEKIGVGIEGYAFGAKGRGMSGLMELGAIIRHKLYNGKHKYVEIPPTTVKKYATGNGKANKQEMVTQFQMQTDIDLYEMFELTESKNGQPPKPIEDVVDAFYIAGMICNRPVIHANIVDGIMNKLKEKTRG